MGILKSLFFDLFDPLWLMGGFRELLILYAICCFFAISFFIHSFGFCWHRRHDAYDEDPTRG